MDVLRLARGELGLERAGQLIALWDEVWPSEDSTSLQERAAGFLADASLEHRMQRGSELFHFVEEEGGVLAVARSYVREVRFELSGQTDRVLALAGVCCAPRMRGRGLGALVVKDVFARLDAEVPWCLFQTMVPGFYEKLGCCLIENEFRDSCAMEPEKRPWWDEHVMVCESSRNWPEGRVDLCGVAY